MTSRVLLLLEYKVICHSLAHYVILLDPIERVLNLI
jgi:hypothetical protein